MVNLYTEQAKNVMKTWLLMTIFFVVVILFGWFMSFYYGNPNILYFFVIFSILMNFFSYWFSDKIVLKLAGAKEAKREEYFNLYTSVENLSIAAGLPMPKVYVIADSAPNAFATGRDKDHAVVAVTTGLLSILEKNELEGVMAHELAHIGNQDMLISTMVVTLVGFVTILADVFMRSLFFGGRRGGDKGGGLLVVIGIVGILAVIMLVNLNPAEAQRRARDSQRVNDMRKLQGAMEQMMSEDGALALIGTYRTSNNGTTACGANWTGYSFCAIGTLNVVPRDPRNGTSTNMIVGAGGFISYGTPQYLMRTTSANTYKFATRFESITNLERMTGDGGTDVTGNLSADWYEVYNDPALTI